MGPLPFTVTTCLTLTSHSLQETQAIGQAIGRRACPGDLYLLSGAMGTGKTCLTQGIAWGMGITEYAHSPTFVLIHQYRGPLTLYHIDLYRLDDPRDVVEIGIDEYMEGEGVCAVEWAEKATEVFPTDHLLVTLEETGAQERRLTLSARGKRYQELVEALQEELA